MNISKNHHYVSQCHLKEFFDDTKGLIYLYDKILDNYYSKKSTKKLFSEEFLNTKEINGKIDHLNLELELKGLFEDDFPKHIEQIKSFIDSHENIQETYESLCWISMVGILGELRHPNYKKTLDENFGEFESNIFAKITGLHKADIRKYQKSKQQTPYSNAFSYALIALRILEKMEPFDFLIYYIESSDHFILPDTSAFQVRGQLIPRNNPNILEIIQLGIPLTNKIFILATPKCLNSGLHGITFIEDENSELVFKINNDLFEFARKAVACKDEIFLKKMINKIKNRGF